MIDYSFGNFHPDLYHQENISGQRTPLLLFSQLQQELQSILENSGGDFEKKNHFIKGIVQG